jgi:hypothetical protein
MVEHRERLFPRLGLLELDWQRHPDKDARTWKVVFRNRIAMQQWLGSDDGFEFFGESEMLSQLRNTCAAAGVELRGFAPPLLPEALHRKWRMLRSRWDREDAEVGWVKYYETEGTDEEDDEISASPTPDGIGGIVGGTSDAYSTSGLLVED